MGALFGTSEEEKTGPKCAGSASVHLIDGQGCLFLFVTVFFVTVWKTVVPPNFICLCVSVCLSVFPAFTVYISVTMDRILMLS